MNLNDQRAEDACQRIRVAMRALREREMLPMAIEQRAAVIAVSGAVATVTDFVSNTLELSEKLVIPAETFQPQLR
ncbi:MAG: hypothetical protein AAFQ89_17120 [Cyanobacteria bacterium J06626_18]